MVSNTYRRTQKAKQAKQTKQVGLHRSPASEPTRELSLSEVLRLSKKRKDSAMYAMALSKYEAIWILVQLCVDRAVELVKRDLGPIKDINPEARKDYDYFTSQSSLKGRNDYYTQGGDKMALMADLLDHFSKYINLNQVRYRLAVIDWLRGVIKDDDILPAYASIYVASRMLHLGNEFYHSLEGRGHVQIYNMTQACANFAQSIYWLPRMCEVDSDKQAVVYKEEMLMGKKMAEWINADDGMAEAAMNYVADNPDDEYSKKIKKILGSNDK